MPSLVRLAPGKGVNSEVVHTVYLSDYKIVAKFQNDK
jgi:hypothetical protein